MTRGPLSSPVCDGTAPSSMIVDDKPRKKLDPGGGAKAENRIEHPSTVSFLAMPRKEDSYENKPVEYQSECQFCHAYGAQTRQVGHLPNQAEDEPGSEDSEIPG